MLIRTNIHQLLRVFKFCGILTNTWPPELTAGRGELLLRDFGCILTILNMLGSLAIMTLGVWHFKHDIIRMMKALSEMMAVLEVIFDVIMCRIARSRLQVCLCTCLCELLSEKIVICLWVLFGEK